MANKMTNEQFIKKAQTVHGHKYDYSKVNYVRSSAKIELLCESHGVFWQTPNAHLAGKGCPECGKLSGASKVASSNEQFLEKANKMHNDKYSYLSEYKNNATKIKISCPEHGEFWQTPKNHLIGRGCSKCARNTMKSKTMKQNNDFVEEAMEIHCGKYEYLTKYDGSKTKIKMLCPEHGEFWQMPHNHLRGKGCSKCGKDTGALKITKSNEEFIKEVISVHGHKYRYLSEYQNTATKIKISCPEHGEFWQTPNAHLVGKGCQECAFGNETSVSEVELLNEIKTMFPNDTILSGDRKIINPLELDIYVPSLNLAIEFNGNYWHSYPKKPKTYHTEKSRICEDKGIRLIHIYEYQWNNLETREKFLKMIKSIGGFHKRVFARKCAMEFVEKDDERKFLEENHLQGYNSSTFNLGLYHKSDLIQMISFINRGNSQFEIQRLCTKTGYSVIGGAEKLFKHSMSHLLKYDCKTLISYSDRGVFTGNVYERLGMIRLEPTEPNYIWFKGNKILSRQQCQKHKLVKMGYDENLSETDIMKHRGYKRIFNSGNHKFEMVIQKRL